MSGINRVTTFSQQQQNLLNLLRNEQSLSDVLLQQSTGNKQSAPPVTSVNTTRIPTKTLTLSGNLDTQGLAPVNSNVAPPAPGSFVDVSLTGQHALFDSNGIQYDTTLRFVHQSAGPPDL